MSSADRAAPDAPGLPVQPSDLATAVLARLPGALLAFDVDGVLAPLVEHVDQSALTPGVDEALAVLAQHTRVTLLSGRSLESLARLLDFPPRLFVIGSHGLEVHGGAGLELTGDEQDLYELLTSLGRRCVDECGPGAWLEYKPASIAVHTRQADRERARDAVAALVAAAMRLDEATVKAGHQVVELFVRATDKGTALLELAARLDATSIVFLGDDRTDEEAFARMAPDDLSVRVGPGDTVARLRLAGHAQAAEFVKLLADSV